MHLPAPMTKAHHDAEPSPTPARTSVGMLFSVSPSAGNRNIINANVAGVIDKRNDVHVKPKSFWGDGFCG